MNALGLAAAWTTVAVVFAAGSAQAQVLPVGAPPLRTPEFCRALTSIIYGLRQPTAGAVLPGFTEAKLSDPNKSKPADAAKDFHAEYVFIRGHSPDMVPQRIVQCTPNGRWLSVLTRADTQEREAYQAVWILPNLTNISMGMLWAPDKGAMLSVLTFSVRPPDAAVPRPFSLSSPFAPAAPTLSPPRPTTGNPYAATAAPTPRYRCQDGREFAIEFIKGSANENIWFKGANQPVTLAPIPKEPHSPMANSFMRFDMGSQEGPDTLSEIRNGKILKKVECPLVVN